MSVVHRARSRLFSTISRNCNRKFSSTVAYEPLKQPIVSSSNGMNDEPPSRTTSPLPPPSAGFEKKSWGFLKYGLGAAVTGGVATAGYATYAYSTEEIDEKTKALRASVNFDVPDDASSLDKFQQLLPSAAISVPAKLIEAYLDLRRSTEDVVRGFTEPESDKLLPDLHPLEQHIFTLVLDLNETLVYSHWERGSGWRTFKRPGFDDFLEHMAQFYEVVVYSDQLSMHVNRVVERLDHWDQKDPKNQRIRYTLSRGATRYVDGKHYRDLSVLNRDASRVLYVSGHALDSTLQPENAVPIKPWTGELEDTALLDIIPFLEYVAKSRPADVRTVLDSYKGRDIANDFIERIKEHQRQVQERKQQGARIWRL